ncbi:sensor histidine kinase [Sphingosinicella sp. BN140058]|uniref:sensor histidine kinase n=1 Tax=Sphingosinicella sp. BN140058 TaxID=1892855 RepID=UPI0013EAC7D3|nr:ATP-binding protein [Sphingosinicella sp. BN140058]
MPHRTSLEAALKKLHTQERLTDEAQRIASIGTYIHDSVSDEGIWSRQLKRIFGLPDDDAPVATECFMGMIHPEDRSWFREAWIRAWRSAERSETEHRIVRTDGAVRHVHAWGQLLQQGDGEPAIMVGTVQDVTDRLVREKLIVDQAEQLRAMEAELLYLSRQSAMGTMASTLAHELNQPLTAITFYAAALKRGEQDQRRRDMLGTLEENALRAGEIIRRLRLSVETGVAKKERFRCDELVNEAITFSTIGCEGVAFELDLAGEEIYGADRVQIQQVLVNLIRNACQAVKTRSDGKVRIATSKVPAADFIRICISDNGAGIPEALLPRVFDSGVSTKESGMGLGLSISRTIVEAHGGRIWAENGAEGARFLFDLPLRTAH